MIETKALIFDMDGTIADLYAVDNWLEKIHAEDVSPYVDAAPMYDMESLSAILDTFKNAGYRIMIVTWGAMNASKLYASAIKKAKKEWLIRHSFPYDEFHCVKYGTPKSSFIKDNHSILIDDNEKVRQSFLKSRRGETKEAIDASQSILKPLLNLLLAE